MRLTKLGHACVRIETNGVRIVIDPGVFSAPDALDGADAVLVTHEHADHVVPEKLVAAAEAAPNLRVWTTQGTAEQLSALGNRVTAVRHGDRFDIAGVDINVYGEDHALVHRDIPRPQNVGFRVNGEVYHPGDSYTVPADSTPILFTPDGGPWVRAGELVDFVREVAPTKAYLIHDAVLTEAGQNLITGILTRLAGESHGCEIINWQPGDTIDTD
jgi:L-ascorbate metabolism protein UlaG (beta-lactamase superfamily)